jgi:hypothetical protein
MCFIKYDASTSTTTTTLLYFSQMSQKSGFILREKKGTTIKRQYNFCIYYAGLYLLRQSGQVITHNK